MIRIVGRIPNRIIAVLVISIGIFLPYLCNLIGLKPFFNFLWSFIFGILPWVLTVSLGVVDRDLAEIARVAAVILSPLIVVWLLSISLSALRRRGDEDVSGYTVMIVFLSFAAIAPFYSDIWGDFRANFYHTYIAY